MFWLIRLYFLSESPPNWPTRLNLTTNDIQWSLNLPLRCRSSCKSTTARGRLIDIWKTDPLWARRCHKQFESYLSRGTPLQKYLWRATRILCPEKMMILIEIPAVGKSLAPQRQRCHPWKHHISSDRAVISHESLSSGIIPVSSPRCGFYPSSDPLGVNWFFFYQKKVR